MVEVLHQLRDALIKPRLPYVRVRSRQPGVEIGFPRQIFNVHVTEINHKMTRVILKYKNNNVEIEHDEGYVRIMFEELRKGKGWLQ